MFGSLSSALRQRTARLTVLSLALVMCLQGCLEFDPPKIELFTIEPASWPAGGPPVTVRLRGRAFESDQDLIIEGSGITTTALIIAGDTSLTTTLTIDPTAPTGPRNVQIVTYTNVATAKVIFTVLAPPAGCTILSDDFNVGDKWTTEVSTTNPVITHFEENPLIGGSPPFADGFRRMEHRLAGQGATTVFHSYQTTYDPRVSGAIAKINYFEAHKEFNPPFVGAAIGWGFYFKQNGHQFVKVLGTGAFTSADWENQAMLNLTKSADFPSADFSASGAPITFGFFRANTNDTSTPITTTHGIDDWKVEICH